MYFDFLVWCIWREEAEFMTYTAASPQGEIKMLWLHFWGTVMSTIYLYSSVSLEWDRVLMQISVHFSLQSLCQRRHLKLLCVVCYVFPVLLNRPSAFSLFSFF